MIKVKWGMRLAWTVFSISLMIASGARADGYATEVNAAPTEEARKFTYSFNLAFVSDYVFRGISQTDNDPAMQGGIDIGYGILYAGWWASHLDFEGFGNDAKVEMDWYVGMRPTWGPLTFDFAALYYTYPGAGWIPPLVGPQPAYMEFKAGVSGSPVKDLILGATLYYSPDNFFETGPAFTGEGSAAYTFHAVGPFTPTVSGVIGYQDSEDASYLIFNGFDNYWYWNAGLALVVEKLTFDFRYWDTTASNPVSDNLACLNHYCDERFVFSAKVLLP